MTSSKTKRATAPKAEEPARQDIPSKTAAPDEEAKRTVTRLITSPELAASRAIVATEATTSVGEHLDLPTTLEQLRGDAAAVNRGDLSQAEAMLMNQATALQTLFARLVGSSMNADFLPKVQQLVVLGTLRFLPAGQAGRLPGLVFVEPIAAVWAGRDGHGSPRNGRKREAHTKPTNCPQIGNTRPQPLPNNTNNPL